MGYHPETLAFSFPPYPRPRGRLGGRQPWSFGRTLYALKPWIGFDIWHNDAEKRTEGQRTDDSCGWFDRRPREYADAVAYVLRDETTMHDIRLTLARRKHTPSPFYEGVSEPREDADRARGYPRLSLADSLALTLMIARELETRRWWNGEGGNGGAHASAWRRKLTRRRKVEDVAYDLALSPIDNLSSGDEPDAMVRLIAGALHRRFKPWWRHPRWHVHHWEVHFDLWRNLKRMIQPCGTCGKRLGFGYCPTNDGSGKLHHGECLGHYAAAMKAPAEGPA